MKLGGGTANGMRALGYQVLPPEPNSDSTCWRMIAPQSRNTEYLAADQAEGWRKAEKHWHARNLENVFRRTPPTPATDECTCFGDSGMQASTFCRSDDVRCCDLCGKPVASTPPTPITEEPWEGPLTDKENAMLEAAWQKHKDAAPPTPATEEREAVAQWCSGCHEVRSVDCYRAGCPKSDTERRAAEILAAEANERARWADWARVRSALNHRWAAEGEHLRTERIALSSAYAELADAIERGEHLA